MTRGLASILFVGLAGVAGYGCAFENPCEFGTCLPDGGGVNAEAGNGSTGNGSTGNGSTGNGSTGNGSTGNNSNGNNSSNGSTGNSSTVDAGPGDDSGTNNRPDAASNNGTNNPTPDSCVVDIFSFQCSDDPYERNDRIFDGEFLGSFGCDRDGDPLPRLNERLSAQVCPLESADYFSVNMGLCNGQPQTVEIEFEILTECDEAAWDLELAASCDAPDVDCTRSGNTLEVTHDGTPTPVSVLPINFGITTSDDVFIDYRLNVRSR